MNASLMPHFRSFLRLLTPAAALAVSASPARAVLTPLIDEVANELTDGQTYVALGYLNTETSVFNVVYGSSNFFTSAPFFRSGQPTAFQPGLHNNVFTTSFTTYSGSSLSTLGWTLSGSTATANPASGVSYVRQVGSATAYAHTSTSKPLPSSSLVVESLGVLTMQSGTLSASTVINRGTGTVDLQGGTLSSSTSFTNSALLRLNGGALSTPSFANTADGVIRVVSGANTLPSFTNSGQLHVEGGSLSVDSLTNSNFVGVTGGTLTLGSAPTLGSTGLLRLDGGTLVMPTLANSGGTLDLRAGTLRLTTANLVANTGGIFGANPVLSAPVTVELQAGRTDIASGRSLTLANGAALRTQGGENNGIVYVINASLVSESGEFVNQSGRTLYAVDAALSFAGDGLRNDGVLNLVNTTVNGDVYSPAGSTINVSNTVVFNGDFHGAANFTGSDTAVFNGGYSPGDSPALVTHEGNLVLGAENLLVMELAGLTRGASYDALDVGGALTFGGELRIDLLGGFSPVGGESFALFDFNPALSAGSFANLFLPDLATGLTWDTSQLYSTGVLSVSAIPEPASFATLLAAGACGAALIRRRNR